MQPNENEDFDATTSGAPVAPVAVNDFSRPAAVPTAPAVSTPVNVTEAQSEAPAAVEPAAAPVAAAVSPKVAKPFPKVPVLAALVVLLALTAVGLGVYAQGLSGDKAKLQAEVTKLNANPQLAVQKQTDKLIADVGELMTLPKDETPTVANVSDAAKAKEQSAFFNNAQNGDRVLMYVKAGQAILYRPSTNKIILVAPLTFNNTAAATTSSTTSTTPARR